MTREDGIYITWISEKGTPTEMTTCKHCLEEIKPGANVCSHCNRNQCWLLNFLSHPIIGSLVSIGLLVLSILSYQDARNERIKAQEALREANKVKTELGNALTTVGNAFLGINGVGYYGFSAETLLNNSGNVLIEQGKALSAITEE